MPVSTSGVSVPQLSQGIDSSIYGNQSAPKGMTIGDMLDISKKSLDLRKAKEVYQPEIDYIKANAQQAQAANMQEQLKNVRSHVNFLTSQSADLLKEEELSPMKIAQRYTEINKNAPGGEDPRALQQVLMGMPQPMQGETKEMYQTRLRSFVTSNMGKGLDNLAQFEKMFPATQQVNVGGQTVTTATGNPDIAVNTPGVPTGPYMQNTLAPTVATSPTGGPMAFGGGGTPQTGNLNNRPVGVQVVPAGGGATATGMQQNAPSGQNAPKTGVTSQSMSQSKGGSAIPYIPGEPYDAFRVRAADVAKMPKAASEALNVNNADSIPNARYTNEKIQKMLDNPNLNIGPIADAIAKQTGGIGLSADQQEIMKYLEQRIRMESARTNQDQASQRTAFGSFGTQKGALREILYKDNGSLAGQELYQRGILNHAGDINKPNLQSVNQFNNDYAKLAEPKVVHLIGVIGDKSAKDLTKADKQHLAKEFAGLSDGQIQELMNKRQKLLDLVGK